MRSKGFLQVVGLHALQFERSLRKSLDNGNPCHAALAGQIAIYRLCKPQDYLGQTLCYAFCMERSQVHAGFAHRRVEIAVADLPQCYIRSGEIQIRGVRAILLWRRTVDSHGLPADSA